MSSHFTHSSVSSFVPISHSGSPKVYAPMPLENTAIVTDSDTFENSPISPGFCEQMPYPKRLVEEEAGHSLNHQITSEVSSLISSSTSSILSPVSKKPPIFQEGTSYDGMQDSSRLRFTTSDSLNSSVKALIDPCSVAHKKKYHYHREFLYQQAQKSTNECSSKFVDEESFPHELIKNRNLSVPEPPVPSDRNYFTTLPLHYENNSVDTTSCNSYSEARRIPRPSDDTLDLKARLDMFFDDRLRSCPPQPNGTTSSALDALASQSHISDQNINNPPLGNFIEGSGLDDDIITQKMSQNYVPFNCHLSQTLNDFPRNLPEYLARSPHISVDKSGRFANSFGMSLEARNADISSSRSAMLNSLNDPSYRNPQIENKPEEKHFTDISGLTVQKSIFVSDSESTKTSLTEDLFRKENLLPYNPGFLSQSFDNPGQSANQFSLTNLVSNKNIHDSAMSLGPSNSLGSLGRSLRVSSPSYVFPELTDQQSNSFKAISRLIGHKPLKVPDNNFGYDRNTSSEYSSNNNIFASNDASDLEIPSTSSLDYRNPPDVLEFPSVDEFCLNLAIPPSSSENDAPHASKINNLSATEGKDSAFSASEGVNCSPFNSPISNPVEVIPSVLSPVNSVLNTCLPNPASLDEIVQSNLPLYPNLPPFHGSNVSLYFPEIKSDYFSASSCDNANNSNALSPSHPINLVVASHNDSDGQFPMLMQSQHLQSTVPISLPLPSLSSSHSLSSFANNQSAPTLSHSVHSITAAAPASDSASRTLESRKRVSDEQGSVKAVKTSPPVSSPPGPSHLLSNILSKHSTSKTKSRNDSEPYQDCQSSCSTPSITRQELNSKTERKTKCFSVLKVPRSNSLKNSISKSFSKLQKQSSKSKVTSLQGSYCCSNCSQEFSSAKLLNKHKMTEHDSGSLECNICKATFKDKASLRQHRLKQCSRRRHVCHYCNKSFGGYSSLVAHRHIHTGERPYSCPHCTKTFRHNATLKSHILTHTGERPFQCSVCSLRFSQRSSLSRHLRTHSDMRQFICTICSRVLRDKDNLARHMKMEHLDCLYCSEKFMNRRELDKHLVKNHTDERPYKCDLCPSTFAVKVNYVKHKKTIHRDIALKCDECGAEFKRVDRMNSHKKIHCHKGAVVVHKCKVCFATFNQRNSLSKHYRAMHNDMPEKQPTTAEEENLDPWVDEELMGVGDEKNRSEPADSDGELHPDVPNH